MKSIVLIACLVTSVGGSHFRGGIISSSPISAENKTMEITFQVSYRRNHVYAARCDQGVVDGGKEGGRHPENQGIFCVEGCAAKSLVSLIRYVCTDFSTTDNWEYGERTLRYTFNNVTTVRLSATGCCWVAPFGSGSWDLFTVVNLNVRSDIGRINSSPQARFFPVINIQQGCNSSIAIRPYDPDGDVVRCRWGVNKECSGICNGFPNAILDGATCTLTYQSQGRDTGFKAVALMMEDFSITDRNFSSPFSTVALNFLVNVYESDLNCTGALPTYVAPTPDDQSCIAIPPSSEYRATVVVDTQLSTISLTELKTVGPVGVNKGTLFPIPASTRTSVNISWTPQQTDYFQNNNRIATICFTGVASSGQSTAERCIRWMAGVLPPKVVPASVSPISTKTSPENPTLTLTFDQSIRKPARPGKLIITDMVTGLDVYSISFGNERSGESIVIKNDNQVTVSTNFRFIEKRNYSVALEPNFVEGIIGCGPENVAYPIGTQSWWFETLDITPPRLFFIGAPTRSNGTLLVSWNSNEPLSRSSCKILSSAGVTLSQYQCSGDSWMGKNLPEGSFTINVTASDLAGNRASRLHTFTVDLTPPEVSVSAPFTGDSSNLRVINFRFKCPGKPSCTYSCVVLDEENMYRKGIDCSRGDLVLTGLTMEGKYRLIVSAIDDVGNQGQNFTFSWNTDYTVPVIQNVVNVVKHCDTDLSPVNESIPRVTDNLDARPMLTYTDQGRRGDCMITRVWTAEDAAGNIASADQTITLTFTPTINLLPQLRLPCDPVETVNIPTQTANVDNECSRVIKLTYSDSPTVPTCPSVVERTWTAIDDCDSSLPPVVKRQTLSFYSICPPSACGRTFRPPRGACIEGRCLCKKPWTGEDCNVIVYAPVIQPTLGLNPIKENEMYNYNIILTNGTPPIYFQMVTAPEGMKINQLTGAISWQAEVVGEVQVRVKAVNGAGMDFSAWNITVTPGYTPTLTPLTKDTYVTAQPVSISGKVLFAKDNLIQAKNNGRVPVDVYILVSDTSRKYKTISEPDGSFSTVFEPLRLEYGQYQAIASHPGFQSNLANVQFDILGMRLTNPVIYIHDRILNQALDKTYTNQTELVNDGPGALTNIEVSFIQGVPDGITMEATFWKATEAKVIPVLNPGDKFAINMKINAAGPFGSIRVFLRFRSSEGVFVNLIATVIVSEARPSFSIQPQTLKESVARGTQKLVQVNITNTGHANATGVMVQVPRVEYISVVSFGDSIYSSDGQNITIGQSILLVCRLSAGQGSKLGRYRGQIGIQSQNAQGSFDLDLGIISNEKATVIFRIEDEFTYFANDKPLVVNAEVRMYNSVRGITMTKTTEDENGLATFSDIPEATYEVHVQAPRHSGVKAVYNVNPGTTTYRVFLQRSAVTYRWTVTPTEIQDVYRIQVEADFETRVPMPVVTVEPTSIDLEPFELGYLNMFELNVTNHGLIRAEEFDIELPKNHPTLEFKPLAVFEDLEARTWQIVPVKVIPKNIKRRKRATCGGYSGSVKFGYECGTWVLRTITLNFRVPVYECNSWNPRRGGGGGGYIRFCCGGPVSSGRSACDPCFQAFFNCLLSFTPLGPLPCILTGINGIISSSQGDARPSDIKDYAICASKVIIGTVFKPLALPINIYDCIVGIGGACLPPPPGSPNSRRKRDVRSQLIANFAEAAKPVAAMAEWRLEVYGKQVWARVDDELWFTEEFIPIIADDSDQGEAISQLEFNTIINSPPPQGVTNNDIVDFLNRWNNTVYDWNNGRLEPTEAEPNRMSYSKVLKYKSDIAKGSQDASSAGFESFVEYYNDRVEALNQVDNWDEEQGVCAVVRVRIEQELTLTREGFNAKLEIDNGEVSMLTNIDVKINIRDAENGNEATMLFSIGNATIGGAITSSRSLAMQESGELNWLLIPYSEAAPVDEKIYDVGGTLYYKVDGTLITVPLLPGRITVQPDPSLLVHYFWEKHVISDDPFTDRIERAVPFSLAVAVKNAGNGTAHKLQITSSQPEIIENEKGLLVTFKMIGANLGNQMVTPSLTVQFGDIEPGKTMVASWWMVSSLRGMFKNYSATFENENPLGDPRLSLLDDLQVHELIHQVDLSQGDVNDGISDFLVNEIIDYNVYPDAVFSSNTLTKYNVTVQNITLSMATYFGFGPEYTLLATPSSNGFVYYRFETPDQATELATFNSLTFNRSISGRVEVLPMENAWFTSIIGERESNVFIGHIFDYITNAGVPHEYKVSYSTREQQEASVVLRPTQPPIDVTLAPDTDGVIVGRVTIPPTSGCNVLTKSTKSRFLTVTLVLFLFYFVHSIIF